MSDKELIEEAQAALPDDARMDGYYIGFDRTGVAAIDAVLSAVAIAGKGAHHTEAWGDDGDGYYDGWPGLPPNPSGWNEALKDDGGSAVSLIQLAANRSAGLVRRLADALEARQPSENDREAVTGNELADAAVAAIERVRAINTGNNRALYGNDFEAGMAKALWLVKTALDGAFPETEPEQEYRVEYQVPGGATHVTETVATFEEAYGSMLENIYGGTVMSRTKAIPAGSWLPVEGESADA